MVAAVWVVLVRALVIETSFKQLLHHEADSTFFIKASLKISPSFPRQAIHVVHLRKVNPEYLKCFLHHEILRTHFVIENPVIADKIDDTDGIFADSLPLRLGAIVLR